MRSGASGVAGRCMSRPAFCRFVFGPSIIAPSVNVLRRKPSTFPRRCTGCRYRTIYGASRGSASLPLSEQRYQDVRSVQEAAADFRRRASADCLRETHIAKLSDERPDHRVTECRVFNRSLSSCLRNDNLAAMFPKPFHKRIKSKVGNAYVAPRWAKISEGLANAPLDHDANFVYAGLQPSLWRSLHSNPQPENTSRRLLQQSQSLAGHSDKRRFRAVRCTW